MGHRTIAKLTAVGLLLIPAALLSCRRAEDATTGLKEMGLSARVPHGWEGRYERSHVSLFPSAKRPGDPSIFIQVEADGDARARAEAERQSQREDLSNQQGTSVSPLLKSSIAGVEAWTFSVTHHVRFKSFLPPEADGGEPDPVREDWTFFSGPGRAYFVVAESPAGTYDVNRTTFAAFLKSLSFVGTSRTGR